MRVAVLILFLAAAAFGCSSTEYAGDYEWSKVSEAASYPSGYNYPVFVIGGEMIAFHDGGWASRNGRDWYRTGLGRSGINSAFQKYVQFRGAVYSLGTMEGNSETMTLGSRIVRTADGRKWETVAERSNLPERVFYAAAVFRERIWIFGGELRGRRFDDIWHSADGVKWERSDAALPPDAGDPKHAVVFRDRIYLIGSRSVHSSDDGRSWRLETSDIAGHPVHLGSYSTAVFDDKIWLIGINRNNGFSSAALRSDDGRTWYEVAAPWTPRGAVAAWVFDGRMYVTGGKYSFVADGETRFVYSNDIWSLDKIR